MKKRRKAVSHEGPIPFELSLRPAPLFIGIGLFIGSIFLGGFALGGRDMKLDCTRRGDGVVECDAFTRTVLGADAWKVEMPRETRVDYRCSTGKSSSCRLVAVVPNAGEREISRSSDAKSDTYRVKLRLEALLRGEGEPTTSDRWGWALSSPGYPLLALALLLVGVALMQWRTDISAKGQPMVLTVRTVRFPLSTTKTYPLAPGTKFERSEAGFLEIRPPGGPPERLVPYPENDALVTQLAKDLRRATPRG